MRRNARLILSIACGALSVVLALAYGESARAEVRAERSEVLERYGGEVTHLVVARSAMSAGTLISDGNVEEREWLADMAPTGAITSLDDVVGVRLTSDVAAGEPLNELDIAADKDVLEVPEGRVAISVRLTDKTGLASGVTEGARVLAYRNVDDALHLITNDTTVLSVSGTATSSGVQTVCLAVLPSSVEDVLAASSDGSLRLALPGAGVLSPADDAAASDGAAEDAGSEEAPGANGEAAGEDGADVSAEAPDALAEAGASDADEGVVQESVSAEVPGEEA